MMINTSKMNPIHASVLLALACCLSLPAQTGDTGKTKIPKNSKASKTTEAKTTEAKKGEADQPKTEKKPKETVVKLPKNEDPMPFGADPEDLRAIRGEQQMIEAERRLRNMIKSGKIKNIDQILSFEELSSWPYEDGLKGLPPGLKKIDGSKVIMTGFMLPIDEVENIKEFLLVQSLWSCCYGQPPDINGIVRVVMKGKARADYQFDPIKIIGTFKVKAAVEDGYCVDIYQLHAESVEVIK